MRIIGGLWRSRVITFPARDTLRPTPDRVRETVFNWLGQRLEGRRCLDLFAGSGALGFEAASRGAAQVVMVENDTGVFAALEASRRALDADAVELVHADALAYLRQPVAAGGRFDVVFLDPPFRHNVLAQVLALLPSRIAPHARVYVEAPAALEAAAPWREVRRGRAGQVHFQLLESIGDDRSSVPGDL